MWDIFWERASPIHIHTDLAQFVPTMHEISEDYWLRLCLEPLNLELSGDLLPQAHLPSTAQAEIKAFCSRAHSFITAQYQRETDLTRIAELPGIAVNSVFRICGQALLHLTRSISRIRII
jgi:hypothetical protein